MAKHTCPKCGSKSAWLRQDGYDLLLRCLCGYLKVVASRLNEMTITADEMEDDEGLKLPKVQSYLWLTLMVIASLEVATSAEITERLRYLGQDKFTVSDVSSYLTILRGKGLVKTLENRRGTAGGSTWSLTDTCIFLLGL